jgi:hypothetical protein
MQLWDEAGSSPLDAISVVCDETAPLMTPMRAVSLIEPLEDRIAPATVTIAAGGKSASYQDTLGDTVTVTTTKGTFVSSQFVFDPSATGQLTQLTLSGHNDFTGANVTFSITPVAGGTDVLNIGYIDALLLNLGSVTVPGDLGRIDVGGGKTANALTSLTVESLGVQGSATQGGLTTSTVSNITGTAGTLNIKGNVDGTINVQDFNSHPGTGNLKTLNIGGSLDGNTTTGAGDIEWTGTLGTVVIGGGIEGGSSNFTGAFVGNQGTFSKLTSITVKGSAPDDPNPSPIPGLVGTSILGGAGEVSGGISAASIGSVNVAGDVFGGSGIGSGYIQGGLTLGKVIVSGSLIGGNLVTGYNAAGYESGSISGGTIGSVTIGKSVEGGSGVESGQIISSGLIKSVTIMGDLAGGSSGQAVGSQLFGFSGVIEGHSIGTVTVKGSVIGGNLVVGDTEQQAYGGGAIRSKTTISSVTIGKNLVGGSGTFTGLITTEVGGVGSISVGGATSTDGSIIGGSGADSGELNINGALNKLSITHNITGGSTTDSVSQIDINGALNSLFVGGSITGGGGDNTGTVSVFGLLKKTTIEGSVIGSSSGATKLTNTGYIQAAGIGTMVIDGSLTAGTPGPGGLDTSGAIRSTVSIGSITLGSLQGNAANPAIVSAVGKASLLGKATSDVAIGNIKVAGVSSFADILAGYSTDTSTSLLGAGVNADAQIGTVTIVGTVSGTNIIAGVGPGANGFGTAGSGMLSGIGVADLPTIVSKISKIVLGSGISPTASGSDSYGISAQDIVSASVGGTKVALTAGADNDTFALGKDHQLPAGSGDTFLYEV